MQELTTVQGPPTIQSSGAAGIDKVLAEIDTEFRSLIVQRAAILRRIGTIKQVILGLANVFGDEVIGDGLRELVDLKAGAREVGFTRTCRLILMESKRPLTSYEVSEAIRRKNPLLLSRHKEPLASVSTVLNRLARYGEARAVISKDGRRAWEWVTQSSALPESAGVALTERTETQNCSPSEA